MKKSEGEAEAEAYMYMVLLIVQPGHAMDKELLVVVCRPMQKQQQESAREKKIKSCESSGGDARLE